MTQQTYVSLADNIGHIARHFSGAHTVGSKFFAAAQDIVVARAEEELMRRFFAATDNGGTAGRVVFEMAFDQPVGTDAAVRLADHADKNMVNVIRDHGTAHVAQVTAVETSDVPVTHKVTVIAGPYGATGQWGIYTMFPGKEAPAFPHAKQPVDVQKKNADFWRDHGFLATRAEIAAHPRADGKPHVFATQKQKSRDRGRGV